VLRPLLGFNHPTTGELLCPASYNWGDLEVRDRLRRGIERVTASDLPTFLWAKGTFDLNDPFKGFLRGPLLVMVWLIHITSDFSKLTLFDRRINISLYPQAPQGRPTGQRVAEMLPCMM
jgi:hypothetical protein